MNSSKMSESFDLIIKNGLCFIGGNLERVDIGIKDSLITEIKDLSIFKANQIIDAKNCNKNIPLSRRHSVIEHEVNGLKNMIV